MNVGNNRRRLSFFVMAQCYSRMMYVEFTVSQTMEQFLAWYQNAFDFFGAVIMIDNLKFAVLMRIVGRDLVFNPKYLYFANRCGFSIRTCNVGKVNERIREENGVGYIKKNFFASLDISDFSAIQPVARHWLDTIASLTFSG